MVLKNLKGNLSETVTPFPLEELWRLVDHVTTAAEEARKFKTDDLKRWTLETKFLTNGLLQLPGITRYETSFFQSNIESIVALLHGAVNNPGMNLALITLEINRTIYQMVEIRRRFDPGFGK